ncbi:MAG: carboxypeptidase-like regulatory domain-containing protein [Terriglobia bacterium]
MKRAAFVLVGILFVVASAFGAGTGSIAGTVKDPSGDVVPRATVVALNVQTGIKNSVQTNSAGAYSFPDLPIGHYTIRMKARGFTEFQETGLVLNVNSALSVDAKLQVGAVSQKVQVLASAVHVNTISTQLGNVISGKMMTSVPLNGRSYTDLLALQPGVVPQASNALTGYSNAPPSGDLNNGTLSMNGARGNSPLPSFALSPITSPPNMATTAGDWSTLSRSPARTSSMAMPSIFCETRISMLATTTPLYAAYITRISSVGPSGVHSLAVNCSFSRITRARARALARPLESYPFPQRRTGEGI